MSQVVQGQPEGRAVYRGAHPSRFLAHVTPKRCSIFFKEGSQATHPPIYQGLGSGWWGPPHTPRRTCGLPLGRPVQTHPPPGLHLIRTGDL